MTNTPWYVDPPTVPIRVRPARRSWLPGVVVAIVLGLLVGGGAVGAYLWLVPDASADGTVEKAAAPVASAPACPDAATLVDAFVARTGFAGARATGPVTCAEGFAVVTVEADQTPDQLNTISAVGPPVRMLRTGTGPVCSDDPADGTTIVPASAAARLNCATSGDGSTAPSAPSAAPAAAVPTLGAVWGPGQKGFGEVRPTETFAGGDPTSILEDLRWSDWGASTATATGNGDWVPPGGPVADSVSRPASVTVSNLGTCHGRPAYLTITWYFPTEGETASDASGFDDICNGP